jgi:hypothetical protein
MRSSLTFILLLINLIIQAQPTITSADMTAVGDTLRTRSTIMGLGINYEQTGPNFTWDFSALSSSSANADTFISLSSTPFIYQLAFNLPFDPNKANLASPQEDFTIIPSLPITDIIEFYKSSSSSFAMCGFGGTLAGLPIPVKFNALDVWYKLPLTSSSPADSTDVSFAQGVSGLGYLSLQRKRVNTVDGWGTMITPVGSYSTLRVKSVVQEVDSIYIDSLNFGISIPRNYVEYKWLANNIGIPVMMVSNINLVPTYTWFDSSAVSNPFSANVGQDTAICPGDSIQLTAVTTGGTPPFFYIWSSFSLDQSITVSPSVTTTYTVTITDSQWQVITASVTVTVLPAPDATISKSPDQFYGCSNEPVTYFTFSTLPGYSMYNWSTGNSGPTVNSITVGPPSAGYQGVVDYSVVVTDTNGCSGIDSTSVEWVICEGMEESTRGLEFNIIPNPAIDRISLLYSQPEDLTLQLDIYNNLGIKIYHTELPGSGAQNNYVIDLKSVTSAAGLFFLKASNGKDFKVKSLIIN